MKKVIKRAVDDVIVLDYIKDHGLAIANTNGILKWNYFLVQVGFQEYQWVGMSCLNGAGYNQTMYLNRVSASVGSFRDMVAKAIENGWTVHLPESQQEFADWIKNVPLNP